MKIAIQSIVDAVQQRKITLGQGKIQLARHMAPYEEVVILLADSAQYHRVNEWCYAIIKALALWDELDANYRDVREIAHEGSICAIIASLCEAEIDLRDHARCEAALQQMIMPKYTLDLYVDYLRNATASDWYHWLTVGQYSETTRNHIKAMALFAETGTPNPYVNK